jgi:hypothetical protein
MRPANFTGRSARRRGTVIVLAAVSMTLMLGVLAVALDGGVLLSGRRHAQAAADASALAAADRLFRKYPTEQGLDPSGTARQAALKVARDNGYTNDGIASVLTLDIPPRTGPFAGRPGYAEVNLEARLPRAFSRLWGSDRRSVRTRAVARGTWGSYNAGILVLDPTSKGSLNAGGSGYTLFNGGSKVIVNSAHPEALIVNGSGGMKAPVFDIYGGYSTPGGGMLVGQINLGVEPTPDPLAYMPQPNPASLPVQSTRPLNITSGNRTLSPGVYLGGVSVGGQANVILQPGIYYIDGGGFTFTGQGRLTGSEVMIFNNPRTNSDKININGSNSSSVSLTPPKSGLYQGIVFFQNRLSSVPMNVAGNGLFTVTGTFYAAGALLSVAGNSAGNVIGSQYISYKLETSGTADILIDWNQNVARVRAIELVE